MTDENFFDMFNRIHNPDYYYGTKKDKKKSKRKPTKRKRPALSKGKSRVDRLRKRQRVANEKEFDKMKLATPVNEGLLYYIDKKSIKLFASYDKDDDGITFGDRTMIPRAWVKKIQKLG